MPSTTFFHLPAEKRERLLAAARAEFVRVPYEDASINRMIREAGIPRGSFYMYFTDKEDLFRYLMESYGQQLVEQVEEWLDRDGGVEQARARLIRILGILQRGVAAKEAVPGRGQQ